MRLSWPTWPGPPVSAFWMCTVIAIITGACSPWRAKTKRCRLRRANWRAPRSACSTSPPTGARTHVFGALDVVPWVALEGWPLQDAGSVDEGCAQRAIEARDSFALWASRELALPVFLYGPERSLPAGAQGSVAQLAARFGPPRLMGPPVPWRWGAGH